MNREEMLKVVEELKAILVAKRVSPMGAEMIAECLLDDVRKENEEGKANYMMEGLFG